MQGHISKKKMRNESDAKKKLLLRTFPVNQSWADEASTSN